MTHPLSTAALIERAATATTEPDAHHVTAAYHAARGLALTDNIDHAADVAALEMALASAATLARRIFDHPANGGAPELSDYLYRITFHYLGTFEALLADLEADAETEPPAVTP